MAHVTPPSLIAGKEPDYSWRHAYAFSTMVIDTLPTMELKNACVMADYPA